MASNSDLCKDSSVCPICFEDFNHVHNVPLTINKCGHIFCLVCIDRLFANLFKSEWAGNCPICRSELDMHDVDNYENMMFSTKLHKLRVISHSNPLLGSVLFSLRNHIDFNDFIEIAYCSE